MSSLLVSPTSGCRKSPSTVSSATLVMYSWARWIGLRVWKPTTVFQPRASNSSRERRGSSRNGAAPGSSGSRARHAHRPGEAGRAVRVQRGDAGVGVLLGAVHQPRLADRVGLEAVGHLEHAQEAAGLVDQLDLVGRADVCELVGGDGERHGHGPREARGQAHVADDHGLVGLAAHEPVEGRHRPDRDEIEVGLLRAPRGSRGDGPRPRRASRRSGRPACRRGARWARGGGRGSNPRSVHVAHRARVQERVGAKAEP